MRMFGSTYAWPFVCALLALTACSSTPEQERKTAVASVATAAMVTEAWLAGSVPSRFARRTLDAMREQLAAAQLGPEKPDANARDARAQAVDPLGLAGEALGQTAGAIERSDRLAAERHLQDIRAAAAAVGVPSTKGS